MSLDSALKELEKRYGPGHVIKGSETVDVEIFPTGSPELDVALGAGGIPRGRIVEIYGPEATGKTSLALHVIAELQKNGGVGAYIDSEHALDPFYAGQVIGVDMDDLLISQPDCGEDALETVLILADSGEIDVIVVDSVAALTPRAEVEGEMGDAVVGLQARLMSQACRKLTGTLSKTGTTCIFINQLRDKIGVMWGSPEVTTGGKALKFYASVRIDLRKIETLKDGGEVIGSRIRAKVVKNKVGRPYQQAEYDLIHGEGISRTGSLIDMGVKAGVIEKAGAWFKYDGTNIGQGKNAAKQWLTDNPDDASVIEQQIKENLNG